MTHCNRSSLYRWIAFFSLALIMGCQGSQAGARRWGGGPYGQGSVERQKARATVFDPYPLNDIGPAVVGGRPPGFMNPLPEPRRNELTQQNPWANYNR